MFNWLKKFFNCFSRQQIVAIVLFILICSFGGFYLVQSAWAFSFAKSLLTVFSNQEEVINANSPSSFINDLPGSSSAYFLNPQLSFPQYFRAEEEINPILLGQDTLSAYSSPLTFFSSKNLRREVITHVVQAGENPWTIAASYGISVNTVLWANKLSPWQYLKVGQELVILPVSGVRHQVVRGETVEKIAKKYRGEVAKILAFNNLSPNSPLEANSYLIIPDGQLPQSPRPKLAPVYSALAVSTNNFQGQSHQFPYGQCTWYVAQKRAVPAWGHAKNWLTNALKAGFSVCRSPNCTPQKGAIISLKETGWLARRFGHVAYVEEVNGDEITISEMNQIGWARLSTRTLKVGDKKIQGYIY